jgi:hypothetical protein
MGDFEFKNDKIIVSNNWDDVRFLIICEKMNDF